MVTAVTAAVMVVAAVQPLVLLDWVKLQA